MPRKQRTAREIAERLGVHPRTVQRYISRPRPEWEAANTISRDKPWEALGISRTTWYNKGKPTSIIPKTKKAQPWDALGMSRATWYRKGKPLEAPTKPEFNEVT